jgi:hypothetical protein
MRHVFLARFVAARVSIFWGNETGHDWPAAYALAGLARAALALQRFATTPEATQAMSSGRAGTASTRSRPAVHVTLWRSVAEELDAGRQRRGTRGKSRAPRGRGRVRDALPSALSGVDFWALSERLSESDGTFVSRSGSPDNLLSNENSISSVAAELAARVKPGGVSTIT